jgi:NAD(P)-dependent dehydrogenase (short-subunit alcohol dehydrogenase family)
MQLDLKVKTVVLTDGDSEFGRAAAAVFAEEGCKLAICCKDRQAGVHLSDELTTAGCENIVEKVDLCDISSIERFSNLVAKRFGGIDVWVNNAEISLPGKLTEITINDFDCVFNYNLRGVFFASQYAMRHMINGGGKGVILNVSSFSALIPYIPQGLYGASKAGINSLTRSFAAMCAPYDIRVMAIAPDTAVPVEGLPKDVDPRARQIKQTALGREARVAEIVEPMVFLASDRCSYMTGSCVEISGGKLCVQNPAAAWPKDLQ